MSDKSKEKPKEKQRNAAATRLKILQAAQKAFSQLGYGQAGVREIAQRVGVSAPMVLRYFGSKAGLFEAALIEAVRMDTLLTTGREGLGQRLVAFFVDERLEIYPPAMIALSANHPDAKDIINRVTTEHVITPFAKWLGGRDSQARALEIFMLSTSYVLYTRQLDLKPASKRGNQHLTQWLAESIQAILDQD